MAEIDHTYWYLARAAGIVAYLMLFAGVTLGLLMTGSLLDRWFPRNRVYDLHRFVSLLTLGLILLHALIVLPDAYFSFSVVELFVPFASPFSPAFMALGAISLYVTIVVVGAFYLRGILSYAVWRLIHYATFGAYVLALVHGIGAGTDTAWAQYLYAATAVIVFNLFVYRVLKGSTRGIKPAPDRASVSARSLLRQK
jgi:methionine sulfoxide reductase heme-binding subunit